VTINTSGKYQFSAQITYYIPDDGEVYLVLGAYNSGGSLVKYFSMISHIGPAAGSNASLEISGTYDLTAGQYVKVLLACWGPQDASTYQYYPNTNFQSAFSATKIG
jgi:hypothetical protein